MSVASINATIPTIVFVPSPPPYPPPPPPIPGTVTATFYLADCALQVPFILLPYFMVALRAFVYNLAFPAAAKSATGVLNEAQVRELRGRVDIEFAAVAAAPEAVLGALDAGDAPVPPAPPAPPTVRPVLALPKNGGRHQYPSQHRQGR